MSEAKIDEILAVLQRHEAKLEKIDKIAEILEVLQEHGKRLERIENRLDTQGEAINLIKDLVVRHEERLDGLATKLNVFRG